MYALIRFFLFGPFVAKMANHDDYAVMIFTPWPRTNADRLPRKIPGLYAHERPDRQ